MNVKIFILWDKERILDGDLIKHYYFLFESLLKNAFLSHEVHHFFDFFQFPPLVYEGGRQMPHLAHLKNVIFKKYPLSILKKNVFFSILGG